jgi:hypothetical protein
MTRIEEIKQAVNLLPSDEYSQFRQWFLEKDWKSWDRQLKADSASGKLDFLCSEASQEKDAGRLKEL